ncbi:hypothetical protein PVAP13_8NG256900 [Panicum virgatum]|uniref:Uncharacterized protein n=1 Tax=Panicum virgatum TaxID=38727 RepID=A0A8T0P986_PANVG|nr:hypothetical protein PVAP13_8NG256900 [Panicum virgatum]
MVLRLAASLHVEEGLNLLLDGVWNRKNRGRSIHKEIAEERLEDSWAPLDETVATEELEEMIHSKEAHTNAVNLESVSPDSKSMSSSYTLLVVVFTN